MSDPNKPMKEDPMEYRRGDLVVILPERTYYLGRGTHAFGRGSHRYSGGEGTIAIVLGSSAFNARTDQVELLTPEGLGWIYEFGKSGAPRSLQLLESPHE